MPTKIEKDSISGHMTTGHEWDGLKELNQPLPKWWIYILYATIVWSAVYFVLYPSWPWFNMSRDNQDGDARQSGWESRCGVGGVGRA